MTFSTPDKNCSVPPSEYLPGSNGFRLEDFEYSLPEELIAQQPLAVRHESRLLLVDRLSSTTKHCKFADITCLLSPGDVLVVNDTRVIPARILARRNTGALIELLLLRPEPNQPEIWHAMATRLRKLKRGEILHVESATPDNLTVLIEDITIGSDGHKRLVLNLGSPERAYALLLHSGYAPLPPYIHRNGNNNQRQVDIERYQTVFAKIPGAVAAPTAGLHFSPEVLQLLQARGIKICGITLHVGPGTFKPITTSLECHTIEEEVFCVPQTTASIVNQALKEQRRVIAVGTTTCRALETSGHSGTLLPTDKSTTSLYIRPGYRFQIISGLLTNFHLSRSSLLVLVSAFTGHNLTMHAYKEAVSQRYRFFSYGDAMLII
ncbi:MAG: tRNA preQ1(34) S-adenosylmethionine ribosyltransferase-isomerase QueA [Candidatus Melainabacteria bacterium]|nr:tRNA preQ1(34) S-adenosylmethionine ribosyltransferase-isomerase QueA [Candidatus Melainabacteria bacterium]